MPVKNYGGRIGMWTIIKVVQKLCHIYVTYQEPLLSYINSSSLTSDQKTSLVNWLNLATASCALLSSLEFVYDR